MGLFFSRTAQTGGFQSENVLWDPQPEILLHQSARKLSMLDEKYLIPQPDSPPPSPPCPDLLIPSSSAERLSEEKWSDP